MSAEVTSTAPKPFVFVLMPFDEKFEDVYKLGIKPACQAAGAYCERVDEQIFQESILERIYNQIAKADLIVSDMTERNANVFYETGYAHALGKKVVLLTQRAEDIPFDLKHYPHIVYSGKIAQLKEELERQVSWYLQAPETATFEPHQDLEYYTNGQRIVDGADVAIFESDYTKYTDETSLKINLSIHNPTNRVVNLESVAFGMILPAETLLSEIFNSIRLPDGRVMLEPRIYSETLSPQGWDSFSFLAKYPTTEVVTGRGLSCTLRIFSRTGAHDIAFNIRFRGIRPVEKSEG